MPSQPGTATHAASPHYTIPWTLFSYLAIGLAALLPRVLDLGVFLTTDEADHWIERSGLFLSAIRSGNYAATAISVHPGVTAMWLGSAGIVLRRTLFESGILHDESFPLVLGLTQLPVALAHVVGILLGYWLLRRWLPGGPRGHPAALAAFLWAADPLLIGYSRVLHVDALAGTFVTLSLLAACVYWYHDHQPATLLLSGVCAGLAILSKSPALALLPIVGLIAIAAGRPTTNDQRPTTENPASRHWSFVARRSSVVALLAWGTTVAVTIFALWPVLWVDPWRAYEQLRAGVAVEGAEPHMMSNFFLGRIDNTPGPLFYPLALVLRLTPWTLIGLLVLRWAWRSAPAVTRHDLAALAGFVVLFIVMMSVFPKKFNRYLVPVFPALDILAAVGIYALRFALYDLVKRLTIVHRTSEIIHRAIPITVSLAALINAAWWHPYGIAYFNPALGGAPMGVRMFLVGWGEGFEQVAAWLNRQPDITDVVTLSPMVSSLRPYMRRHAQVSDPSWSELPSKSGYMVVYIRQVQGGPPPPPFDQFYGRATPLYTVTIHGVDYAWMYQIPPPVAQPRPAAFGSTIRLRGYEQNAGARGVKGLSFKLFWGTQDAPPGDYRLFAHLIGPDGRRYAQVDLPYSTSSWGANRFVTTDLPLASLENGPSGTYRLIIGLYDPASGQRLPLATSKPIDPTIDGPDALQLTQVSIERRP